MDYAALVATCVFAFGVAVALGRLSARVDNLEESRRDMRDDIKAIRAMLDKIAGAIEHVNRG